MYKNTHACMLAYISTGNWLFVILFVTFSSIKIILDPWTTYFCLHVHQHAYFKVKSICLKRKFNFYFITKATKVHLVVKWVEKSINISVCMFVYNIDSIYQFTRLLMYIKGNKERAQRRSLCKFCHDKLMFKSVKTTV